MIESRPEFDKIASFDEFNKYYWYRDELSQICKSLGLEYRGTKQELNDIIEQYFKGNLIKKSSIKRKKKRVEVLTLNTPLLECGFSFNAHFREYFSTLTDVSPFKFTADMATAWRKVKRENDLSFTIQDMLKVYYGNSDYAKYDHSVCQWNQFLKDFCADENSRNYSNKLKVASILWKEVRNSSNEKIYSKNLLTEYADKIIKAVGLDILYDCTLREDFENYKEMQIDNYVRQINQNTIKVEKVSVSLGSPKKQVWIITKGEKSETRSLEEKEKVKIKEINIEDLIELLSLKITNSKMDISDKLGRLGDME